MTKSTKKALKRTRAIAKLAPKTAPAPAVRGPRGGKTATRPDRQVAMTFKISQAQYRLLTEARLDHNVTFQEFLLRAVDYYFEHERGIKFLAGSQEEEVT
jgi:hypothetical protein